MYRENLYNPQAEVYFNCILLIKEEQNSVQSSFRIKRVARIEFQALSFGSKNNFSYIDSRREIFKNPLYCSTKL